VSQILPETKLFELEHVLFDVAVCELFKDSNEAFVGSLSVLLQELRPSLQEFMGNLDDDLLDQRTGELLNPFDLLEQFREERLMLVGQLRNHFIIVVGA